MRCEWLGDYLRQKIEHKTTKFGWSCYPTLATKNENVVPRGRPDGAPSGPIALRVRTFKVNPFSRDLERLFVV